MENVTHCAAHREKTAEYACPACKNLALCEACKLKHEAETGHALENCKEVGLAIMRQCIQDVMLGSELYNGLFEIGKELCDGLVREMVKLESNYKQTEERCSKMQELDSKGKYNELYCYAKSLTAGGEKGKAAMGELNKRVLEIFDKTSKELKKVLIAAVQYKSIFAAYNKDEVLELKGKSYQMEEQVVSALKTADMSTKVKVMYINPNIIIGDRVASELALCLQIHPISALYFGGDDISDVGAELLAQAAFRCKSLSAFCIESNKISDTGAKAIAEGARGCHLLTMFYFEGWRISDSGAKTVAEAIKDCPLSMFYFGSRRISDAGATAVAEMVKDCPLSVFCLAGNEISDAGAIAVAKVMAGSQLSAFYLAGDRISDAGATAVTETLSSSGCASTLSAFYIFGNYISDSGAKKVASAVRGCPLLSEFFLDGNSISGETVAYILEGMAGVSTIRSVNLNISDISKEQMDSCLGRLQQSGVASQLKLRFECGTEADKSVYNKFAAEWNAKLAEFAVVRHISDLFMYGLILSGSPW